MSDLVLPVVLVTGATGYIATHVLQQLFETKLYQVRGTTRDLDSKKSKELRELFPKLELVACSLTDDKGWSEAFKGVTFVLHMASPYHQFLGGNVDDFVKPAVEGTRRVMEFAAKVPSLKRVVVTSSTAAVVYGHDDEKLENETLGPEHWTNLDSGSVTHYTRSKTLAEKLVWEFKKTEKPSFDVCTMNPGWVVGPLLAKMSCKATSSKQVTSFLTNENPMLPKNKMSVVDVRDVACAHVRALDMNREVDGKRYILVSTTVWMVDVPKALHEEFAPLGYNPKAKELYRWFVWAGSFFSSALDHVLYNYNVAWKVDGSLAVKELLDVDYRPWKKALNEHAHALIQYGVVAKTPEYEAKWDVVEEENVTDV